MLANVEQNLEITYYFFQKDSDSINWELMLKKYDYHNSSAGGTTKVGECLFYLFFLEAKPSCILSSLHSLDYRG